MNKLIVKLFPEKDETGIRLAVYGFLIAMPAVALAFAGLERFGYWVGLGGALMGLVGIVLHFCRNWRKIFLLDR